MCVCVMRTRQKLKEKFNFALFLLPSPFIRRSFFLPRPVFPTGAQHLPSATAEGLLHPDLEPYAPVPYMSILYPLPLGLALPSPS